jgi:hypothetical protein
MLARVAWRTGLLLRAIAPPDGDRGGDRGREKINLIWCRND